MKRRTALITGASAGIGIAFANEFAAHGFDVVLVARRKDRLEEIAEQISSSHHVEAHVMAFDLADSKASSEIVTKLKEDEIHIDALVNNAGYALNDGFIECSWEDHLAMHQVMLTCYTELCYRLLPGMLEKGFGRIINVSSLAAFAPSQAKSMYTGIKRYVVDLSTAIDFEFRERGIHCCAVCPGFTYTEFHDVMGVREQTKDIPKIMWQSGEEVAREGYQAVMDGKVVVITGWVNRILAAVVGSLPIPVQFFISRRTALFEEN